MATLGQITLEQVYDLALLYLSMVHGTDARLTHGERRTVALRLREWMPEKDPALIDHVLREAELTYFNDSVSPVLDQIVERLAHLLGTDQRQLVLQDLKAIAQADRVVLEAEQHFVDRITAVWDQS